MLDSNVYYSMLLLMSGKITWHSRRQVLYELTERETKVYYVIITETNRAVVSESQYICR
jgi:hypothetical protein